jgi:hypothetical protein
VQEVLEERLLEAQPIQLEAAVALRMKSGENGGNASSGGSGGAGIIMKWIRWKCLHGEGGRKRRRV